MVTKERYWGHLFVAIVWFLLALGVGVQMCVGWGEWLAVTRLLASSIMAVAVILGGVRLWAYIVGESDW